jgi:pyruvate/oxaloacetate carboxyltransferase
LAIAEFLYQDKPVLSFKGGIDQNHIFMLNDKGMWYHDYDSVVDSIINFDRLPEGQYKNLVNQFTPSNVMDKFNDVFIKGVI